MRKSRRASAQASVWARVWKSVRDRLWDNVWNSVRVSVGESLWASVRHSLLVSLWDSLRAYQGASQLAFSHVFDVYLAPNALHALAHFNELVSGYGLDQDTALLVCRPRLLARDAQGATT